MNRACFRFLFLLLLSSSSLPARGTEIQASDTEEIVNARGEVYPGKSWKQVDSPEAYGWSTEGLKAAEAYASTTDTHAVMVVEEGRLIYQWGQVKQRLNCQSIRKSFLCGLLGIYEEEGKIDLNATVGELGLEDKTPLTKAEKEATVADLMQIRSGIFLPCAYQSQSHVDRRPARGSHPHGTFFYYNNWDFNGLGTIFRQEVGSIGEEFEKRIGQPIGMEKFRGDDVYLLYEHMSIHPAYCFRMTAQDMARFGLLYQRQGRWGDKQILPADWVDKTTKPLSKTYRPGLDYGHMWWTTDEGKPYPGVDFRAPVYIASGSGGGIELLFAPSESW